MWRSLADLRHMVVYKKECGEIIRKELFASHYEIPLHLKMCFANCCFPWMRELHCAEWFTRTRRLFSLLSSVEGGKFLRAHFKSKLTTWLCEQCFGLKHSVRPVLFVAVIFRCITIIWYNCPTYASYYYVVLYYLFLSSLLVSFFFSPPIYDSINIFPSFNHFWPVVTSGFPRGGINKVLSSLSTILMSSFPPSG